MNNNLFSLKNDIAPTFIKQHSAFVRSIGVWKPFRSCDNFIKFTCFFFLNSQKFQPGEGGPLQNVRVYWYVFCLVSIQPVALSQPSVLSRNASIAWQRRLKTGLTCTKLVKLMASSREALIMFLFLFCLYSVDNSWNTKFICSEKKTIYISQCEFKSSYLLYSVAVTEKFCLTSKCQWNWALIFFLIL